MHDHHNRPQAHSGDIGEETHMAKDPVCGMNVDRRDAKHSAEYGGHTYYFCSQGCKTKFVADPSSYVAAKTETSGTSAGRDAIYTCPMHPEIRQTGPGHCPICGMTLEPDVASADSGPNPELADMTRRFWIALALSLPVVVLEMGGHLFDLHMLISQMTSNWVQFFLATPVVLWAGWPFFERGGAIARDTQFEHVHADRHGHWRRLGLQRRRDIGAGSFSASVPGRRRLGRDLFRGRRGDHRSRAARAGAGAPGA